jgi:tripartite-type tricarboxylate transporter receptor subunit TctC
MERSNVYTLICAVVVLASLVLPAGTRGAEFPDSPISIVVGFEPGGPFDLTTRAMAPAVASYLGQPVVVENKGGSGGAVALSYISTVRPDGYKLCSAPDDAIVQTALMQKVPFKPLRSFTPIIGFGASIHTAVIVKSDAPWKSFKELVEYARENPGKVKYSTPGIGTGMHIAMEVVAVKAGIKWVHVPYKGVALARTAVLGGHIDACSSSIDWVPHVQSGGFRVLATQGKTRSPYFPDVPTFKELGYDFANYAVYSIFGPEGMPPRVVEKLEAAFAKAMETEEFKKVRDRLYLSPVSLGSKEYPAHLKEKWVETEKIFKEVGLIKEPATQPY